MQRAHRYPYTPCAVQKDLIGKWSNRIWVGCGAEVGNRDLLKNHLPALWFNCTVCGGTRDEPCTTCLSVICTVVQPCTPFHDSLYQYTASFMEEWLLLP